MSDQHGEKKGRRWTNSAIVITSAFILMGAVVYVTSRPRPSFIDEKDTRAIIVVCAYIASLAIVFFTGALIDLIKRLQVNRCQLQGLFGGFSLNLILLILFLATIVWINLSEWQVWLVSLGAYLTVILLCLAWGTKEGRKGDRALAEAQESIRVLITAGWLPKSLGDRLLYDQVDLRWVSKNVCEVAVPIKGSAGQIYITVQATTYLTVFLRTLQQIGEPYNVKTVHVLGCNDIGIPNQVFRFRQNLSPEPATA